MVDDLAAATLAVSGAIAVVSYDPQWPRRFELERTLLQRVLKPWLDGDIHHVGSTAIPCVAAKPLIDMIASVRDLQEASAAFQPLRDHSYVHTPHRPGIAHHFSKPSARLPETEYGLHLTEPGSDLWLERLAFRDALRRDPALATEYQALKLRLAKQHPLDLHAYTAGKRGFVARVLRDAGIELGRR